jgi:hypothetical protein
LKKIIFIILIFAAESFGQPPPPPPSSAISPDMVNAAGNQIIQACIESPTVPTPASINQLMKKDPRMYDLPVTVLTLKKAKAKSICSGTMSFKGQVYDFPVIQVRHEMTQSPEQKARKSLANYAINMIVPHCMESNAPTTVASINAFVAKDPKLSPYVKVLSVEEGKPMSVCRGTFAVRDRTGQDTFTFPATGEKSTSTNPDACKNAVAEFMSDPSLQLVSEKEKDRDLGMRVQALDAQSVLAKRGIKTGDILVEIAGKRISPGTLGDLAMGICRKSGKIKIKRSGKMIEI